MSFGKFRLYLLALSLGFLLTGERAAAKDDFGLLPVLGAADVAQLVRGVAFELVQCVRCLHASTTF